MLEDRMEIQQLIMSYPLAIDSGAAEFAESLWTVDGVFDRGPADADKHSGEYQDSYGLEMIVAELNSPELQSTREGGLCHVMSAPHVTINGDEAVAVGYTLLIRRDGKEFPIRRPTANRWDLIRTGNGWRIKRRTLRLIDGSTAARELLESNLVAQQT
jgi:hypothetical protein